MALFGTLQSALFYTVGSLPFRQAEAITVVATGVGMIFAYGSARRRGAFPAALLMLMLSIEQFGLTLPGRQLFCAAGGTSCDIVGSARAQIWPLALGVAVGIAARRIVRPKGRGLSALAVGLGLTAISSSLGVIVSLPFVGYPPSPANASTAIDWSIGAALVGAALLGLVVGIFGRRSLLGAVLIALFYVGPWLPQLRSTQDLVASGRPFIVAIDWPMFAPPLYAATALLAAAVAILLRRYGPQSVKRGFVRWLTR